MTMEEHTEETAPVAAAPQSSPEEPEKKRRRWWLAPACILILLLGGGVGSYLGYRAGLQDRIDAQNQQRIGAATQQFALGVADLESGRYEMARKRFEYVINLDPGFPGVADKLAEAMLRMAQALTPTPEPLPTVEPTPDLRNEEQLFAEIRQNLLDQNWELAIANIERLRTLNLGFRAVDVDGMYYIALRFNGIHKILNEGQLEVGIYNLTLSERFAPLDEDAKSYRNWARQYIAAASFWGVDWAQVVAYFADIYPALPNLRDASGMTATERFRIASIKYGDYLMSQEQYCEAQIQYQNALNLFNDPAVQPTAVVAGEWCLNPPGQEEPTSATPTATGTATPGGEGSVTPGADATPTETPTPPQMTGGEPSETASTP